MKTTMIIDQTLYLAAKAGKQTLSFREKLEISKRVSAMHPDMLDAGEIKNEKADCVLLHAIAPEIGDITLACRCALSEASVDAAAAALSAAGKKCLIISVPSSPVRMEYDGHRKAPAMLQAITETVTYAMGKGADVAVCFEDATRAEKEFLSAGIAAACESGAKTVILQDMAGTFLPGETAQFFAEMQSHLSADACLIADCSNEMDMATANALAAVMNGAGGVCTALCSRESADTVAFSHAMHLRGDRCGIRCNLDQTGLMRAAEKISAILTARRSSASLFAGVRGETGEATVLTSESDIAAVAAAVKSRGYDLTQEDVKNVSDAVAKLPSRKEITGRELDALIASFTMQAPPAYKLVSYHVNCSNIIAPTAHVVLEKDGKELQGLSVGDGPIDAAFLAIEQIAGRHFELDDFQIQSVTEGRGAMGDALVRLRHEGRLYSGKGLSTDILGASISAYINALNKIAYEESNA
ncbi:MAG: hypothetical protein IKW00_00320 [Clostridia bacterium]|nr:hypothetical protein [Clostridia bacterium]